MTKLTPEDILRVLSEGPATNQVRLSGTIWSTTGLRMWLGDYGKVLP